jgi:tRNA 2-thiouridine synthesizing protein A
MDAKPDRTLDLRGKECPFTILEVGKALETLESGDLLRVISDRESIIEDLRAWCEGTGTEFVKATAQDNIDIHLRKP